MGFLSRIREGLKEVWSGISGILRKAPIPTRLIDLEEMMERDDVFSRARAKLMRDFGMTKDEATEAARDIAYTPEAIVPDDLIDTWRIMYPERG